MRKLLITFIALLLLAVTAAAVSLYWSSHQEIKDGVRSLKRAVTKNFHDPESARFRSVTLQSFEGPIIERMKDIDLNLIWKSTPDQFFSIFRYDPELFQLCGEVNAKNGFGAYVGYRRFYIRGNKDPVPFVDSKENEDFAKRMCDIGKDVVVFSEPDTE